MGGYPPGKQATHGPCLGLALDEQDDVQGVFANYQFNNGVIEALGES